jgi:hypothetical protein
LEIFFIKTSQNSVQGAQEKKDLYYPAFGSIKNNA